MQLHEDALMNWRDAASIPDVDMSLVMALQGVRLVMALAPALTRLVVRSSAHLRAPLQPGGS